MTSTIHCAGCQHAYVATALFCPNCGRPRAQDAAGDPLLGKVLGERFLVQELLGQGGSGTIYRAEHVTLRRKVAIKVLHTELSRDDLAVERFRREATTVAEIDNEHIVEIHDFGRTHDGRLYLAMELLEGETLDTVLARDKQLSVERAADILIQVGEAMMEAHAIGYVHRDLRPRNIYLAVRRGKANFIKLLDFGLAKLVETEGQAASTSLGMTFGDPRYMSPEQARGDRIDRRADIYQLGCVAYEMLTGAPPFSGNRVFDILTKQVTEIPQPLPTRRPGVPLWMEAAVTKMLAKDPENRFATTTRMVEALRRGLETGEVMEDEVARRRESVPPPSVSRVMQRLGMQSGDLPPVPATPASAPAAPPPVTAPAAAAPASPAAPAPTAGAPPAAPAGAPPAAPAAAPPPAMRAGIPPVDPGATMRGPSAAAPVTGKPDSVELMRKRTGTPRIGVPLLSDPGVVLPAQSPVALPVQSPVAGVIESAVPARPQAPVLPAPPAATAPPHAAAPRPAASAPVPQSISVGSRPIARPVEPEPVLPANQSPNPSEDVQPMGRRTRPVSSDLNISQTWYEEGDRLSRGRSSAEHGAHGDSEDEARRARRTIAPSDTEQLYDDEPPRRRWGLIAGVGIFVAIGGVVAFALTRGPSIAPAPGPARVETSATAGSAAGAGSGSSAIGSTEPPPPSQVVASEPAGSAAAPPAVPAAPPPAPTAPVPTAATRSSAATAATRSPAAGRRVADARDSRDAAPHTPASSRRAAEAAAVAPGSEPSRRPPSLNLPAAGPSPAPSPSGSAPGLTDSPRDPYGDDSASGGASDKKAEFFANVGAQQLASGDTAGAASNFKKALELDGKSVAAMLGMGEIALRQGLFGDALAHLAKAAKLAPRNPRALTLLGEAYLNSGNSAQAAAQFKKALQIDPDNARARDGYNEASSRAAPQDDAQ